MRATANHVPSVRAGDGEDDVIRRGTSRHAEGDLDALVIQGGIAHWLANHHTRLVESANDAARTTLVVRYSHGSDLRDHLR